MRKLVASPRRRRRLTWLAVVLVAAGAAVAVGLLYPNTGERELFSPGKPKVTHQEPPSTPLAAGDVRTAQRTLSKFVVAAVLREHVEDSYDLVGPTLRAGLSRREWRTGDIPVPPFPANAVALIRSKLVYSQRNFARYQVLMLTKPTAELSSLLYQIELTRPGPASAWRVDYALPIGGGLSTRPTPYRATPLSGQAEDQGPSGAPLPLAWVIVPLAILSLIVIVPLALGARGWIGARRAERGYGKTMPPLPPTRS